MDSSETKTAPPKKYPASFPASLAKLAPGPYFCKLKGSQQASLCFLSGDQVIELQPARQMTFGAFAAAGLTIIDGVVSESAAVEAADHGIMTFFRGLAAFCVNLPEGAVNDFAVGGQDFLENMDEKGYDPIVGETVRQILTKLAAFPKHS